MDGQYFYGAKTGAVMLFLTLPEAAEACMVTSATAAVVLDIVRQIRLSEPSVKTNMFWPSLVSV